MTDETRIQSPEKSTASSEGRPGLVRVGITQGDTNGVGFELILRTFADSALLDLLTPVVYGHIKAAAHHRKALNLNTPLHIVNNGDEAEDGRLNFVNISDEDIKVEYGRPSSDAGRAAYLALDRAVSEYKQGMIDVLVTAPINKADIQSAKFNFPGHTEFLQARLGADDEEALMILFNNLMRVALVTTHLPLSEVSTAVSRELVERKIRLLYDSLRRDFLISTPRIAVLALNPHCGDAGLLGLEEQEVIAPTVSTLSEVGLPCFGPYAADGFFGSGMYRHFDGILAMYHDQGLAPFKALSVDDGVNFTAGLPLVRTSPDHGTAYDIAGRGIANLGSFRSALFAAVDIFRRRETYDQAEADPLPKLFHDKKDEGERPDHRG